MPKNRPPTRKTRKDAAKKMTATIKISAHIETDQDYPKMRLQLHEHLRETYQSTYTRVEVENYCGQHEDMLLDWNGSSYFCPICDEIEKEHRRTHSREVLG